MPIIIRRTQVTREELAARVIGQNERIVEGIINQTWSAAERAILAGSLGLTSISNITLIAGTTLNINIHARVVSPGSNANTVRIRTYMQQVGSVRVGTPRYTTFSPAFTGTPNVFISSGSPVAARRGSIAPYVTSHPKGSFAHKGSATLTDCPYMAIGPESYPLNFVALGY